MCAPMLRIWGQRLDAALVDPGSRWEGFEQKCLVNAVLSLVEPSMQHEMRARLLPKMRNDTGFGHSHGPEAALNLRWLGHVLQTLGCCVGLFGADSLDHVKEFAFNSWWIVGEPRGMMVGHVVWDVATEHAYVVQGERVAEFLQSVCRTRCDYLPACCYAYVGGARGKDVRPPPLINPTNACYLNATVQGMWACLDVQKACRAIHDSLQTRTRIHMDETARRLSRAGVQENIAARRDLLLAHAYVKVMAQNAPRGVAMKLDALLCKDHYPRNHEQQDAREYLSAIFEEATPNTLLGECFTGELRTVLVCSNAACKAQVEAHSVEAFQILPLQIQTGSRPLHTLTDALAYYLQTKPTEAHTAFHCSRCGSVEAPGEHPTLLKMPAVLCIQLVRWAFNRATGQQEVLGHRVHIPARLHVESQPYRLKSIVYHRGATVKSGHYWCVAGHHVGNKETWWHYNDDVRQQAAAGEQEGTSKDWAWGKAYLIFYERADDNHLGHEWGCANRGSQECESNPTTNRPPASSASSFSTQPADNAHPAASGQSRPNDSASMQFLERGSGSSGNMAIHTSSNESPGVEGERCSNKGDIMPTAGTDQSTAACIHGGTQAPITPKLLRPEATEVPPALAETAEALQRSLKKEKAHEAELKTDHMWTKRRHNEDATPTPGLRRAAADDGTQARSKVDDGGQKPRTVRTKQEMADEMHRARQLGDKIGLSYVGFVDSYGKMRTAEVPHSPSWPVYWSRGVPHEFFACSRADLEQNKTVEVRRLHKVAELGRMVRNVDPRAAYIGFGADATKVITEWPPYDSSKDLVYIEYTPSKPEEGRFNIKTSVDKIIRMQAIMELGLCEPLAFRHVSQLDDDFAPPDRNNEKTTWRLEYTAMNADCMPQGLCSIHKTEFTASFEQVRSLKALVTEAYAMVPPHIFAGSGEEERHRHMSPLPAQIRCGSYWWLDTVTGECKYGSIANLRRGMTLQCGTVAIGRLKDIGECIEPPLIIRSMSQKSKGKLRLDDEVSKDEACVWEASTSCKRRATLTYNEVLELSVYQGLARKMCQGDLVCAYAGRLGEITDKVKNALMMRTKHAWADLCLGGCQCSELFWVPRGRYHTRASWCVNGVIKRGSYMQTQQARGKLIMGDLRAISRKSHQLTPAGIRCVGDYYKLEFLGQLMGRAALHSDFATAAVPFHGQGACVDLHDLMYNTFDTAWHPAASDTEEAYSIPVWWRECPDGEPFSLPLGTFFELPQEEVRKAIERHSFTPGPLFFQKVLEEVGVEYLGPLVLRSTGEGGSSSTGVEKRCEPTVIPQLPCQRSPAQRLAFWRSKNKNVFRATLQDVLANGLDYGQVRHEDYVQLGGRVGLEFAGTDLVHGDVADAFGDSPSPLPARGNQVAPSISTEMVYWRTAQGEFVQRSFINVLQSALSEIPTSKGVAVLLQALSARRKIPIETIGFEDVETHYEEGQHGIVLRRHFDNAQLSLRLRSRVVDDMRRHSYDQTRHANSMDTRSQTCTPTAERDEGSDDDIDARSDEAGEAMKLRLATARQNSLYSHVPPAKPTWKGRKTDFMSDTLKQACPDYEIFAQYGRDLLLDDFIVELERHFDDVARGLGPQPANTVGGSSEEPPVVESRKFEQLPIPNFIQATTRSMEDFRDDGKRAKIRWALQDDYAVQCAPEWEDTWFEDTLKLLRASAFIAWRMLRRHWSHLGVCNTDAYRIRTLAMLAAEERRNALRPLYSHLCAFCGRLLGEDVGSDVYFGEAHQVRYEVCHWSSQPPFLLLWSGSRLATQLPYLFEWTEDGQELWWRQRDQEQLLPPWCLRNGGDTKWTYCRCCCKYLRRDTEARVPMRNMLEVLRTRLHLDKCHGAIYTEIQKDMSWWPDVPEITAEEALDQLTGQFQEEGVSREDTKRKLSELMQTGAFGSKTALLRAIGASLEVKKRRTDETEEEEEEAEVDMQDETAALDDEDLDPEVAAAMHDLRLQASAVGAPDTPIPKEFFASVDWTASGSLVPNSSPILWQDAGPDVPFHKITSQNARTAVSIGRIYSHFRRTRKIRLNNNKEQKQVPCYSHGAGSMQIKSRFPCEDMGLLGIIAMSAEAKEKYFHMSQEEWSVVEECMKWARQRNIWIRVYKSNLETLAAYVDQELTSGYVDSAGMMTKLGTEVEKALGREDVALLMTDLSEYGGQYGHLLAALEKIGQCIERSAEVTPAEVESHGVARKTAEDLHKYVHLSFQDVNLDAKVFTHLHVHGSGSHNSIQNCVAFPDYLQARMHDLEDSFRKDRVWPFFQEDRKVKLQLARQARFTRQEGNVGLEALRNEGTLATTSPYERRHGRRPRPEIATKGTERQRAYYQHKFGSHLPSAQIDSSKYYKKLKQDFLTIIRPENRGTPTGMLTYVGNDRAADIRTMLTPSLGALAPVPEEFHIAHMFSSSLWKQQAPPIYEHPAIVTMSYMKHKKELKQRALRRGCFDTSLGVVTDNIARTEEQQRKALHEHDAFMCEPCGADCQAQSRYCLRNPHNVLPEEVQNSAKDNLHRMRHMAYVQTELVRPHEVGHEPKNRCAGPASGAGETRKGRVLSAMTEEDCCVAYYLRRVQIQWMIHRCSSNYCRLHGRACRFFFPYCTVRAEQEQDESIDRVAHIRRHLPDDAWVAAHNLDTLVLGGCPVQIQVFDPLKGGRMAGVYIVKYCGKEEKVSLVETVHPEDTEVTEYLKTRIVGACMAFFRHNGGRVAELHHDVWFFPCEFESSTKVLRPLWHQQVRTQYPHQLRFLCPQEKFFFRPGVLRHLRVDQWYRYYTILSKHQAKHGDADERADTASKLTAQRGFTYKWREIHNEKDDPDNPNYDQHASQECVGTTHAYEPPVADLLCRRRSNANFGFLRCWSWAPTADIIAGTRTSRDHFFESALLRALPWYYEGEGNLVCEVPCKSVSTGMGMHNATTHVYMHELMAEVRQKSATLEHIFEPICQNLEKKFSLGVVCRCCTGECQRMCRYCRNPWTRIGFHTCERSQVRVWRPGTLWNTSQRLAENYLWDLVAQGVGIRTIRSMGEELVKGGLLKQKEYEVTIELIGAEVEKEVVVAQTRGEINFDYTAARNPGTAKATKEKASTAASTADDRIDAMRRVWNPSTEAYEYPAEGTSQSRAFEQMQFRQQGTGSMFVCLYGGAGYGKSHLLLAFLDEERRSGREWACLAPSGVAAKNVGGMTLHYFFLLRIDYSSAMEPESEQSARLQRTGGLVIDEFTMMDTKALKKIKKLCQTYALLPEYRKPGASPEYGFRDVVLCGDLSQLPPASGYPPIVTHPDFQNLFEFFVLKENRRQEKNQRYAFILHQVKRGGGATFRGMNADAVAGEVHEEVRNFFIGAYVRGWNVSGRNVDIERGVALTSYRRFRDVWCNDVVDQIEEDCAACEKVDVSCYYSSPQGDVQFDPCNEDHRKNKQQYPKLLRLRTHAQHQCRTMLLRNIDVAGRGLTNGSTLRLLPRNSWSGAASRNQMGRQDAQGRWRVRHVSLLNEPDFSVYAEKDDGHRLEQRVHVKGDGVHVFGVAKEDTVDQLGLGSVNAIPMALAYACTVHKGQGLTIHVVLAILEGLFAHGQVYVQTSRTPLEENFCCVGVPPQDLFQEVLHAVAMQAALIENMLGEPTMQTHIGDWRARLQEMVEEGQVKLVETHAPWLWQIAKALEAVDKRGAKESHQDIVQILTATQEKLSFGSGVRRMVEVTKQYELRLEKDEDPANMGVAALQRRVARRTSKRAAMEEEGGWATLQEALCPDPRATSTYEHIIRWIHDEDVDTLQGARPGIEKKCERAAGNGAIQGRPAFLWGEPLPGADTNWWGGGVKERDVYDTDDEAVDYAKDTEPAPASMVSALCSTARKDVETGTIMVKEGEGMQLSAGEVVRSGVSLHRGQGMSKMSRKTNPKRRKAKVQQGRSDSGKHEEGVKLKDLQRKLLKTRFIYECGRCGQVRHMPTKIKPSEVERSRHLQKRLRCGGCLQDHPRGIPLEDWKCRRCQGRVDKCHCTSADMSTFARTGSPGTSRMCETRDYKEVYFLHCPGPCRDTIGFCRKPLPWELQGISVSCWKCKAKNADAEEPLLPWRHRLMTAQCQHCNEIFGMCKCQDPYGAESSKLITEAGVRQRALKRKRYREEVSIICGAWNCQEEIDQDELTKWTMDRLLQGGKQVARCPKCDHKNIPRTVPRCELICPECGASVSSKVLQGQAHEHEDLKGGMCYCRFRWANGEVIRRFQTEWRCSKCERWKSNDGFTITQRKEQGDLSRRCTDCMAADALAEQERLTQLPCDGSDCEAVVDISGLPSQAQKDRRKIIDRDTGKRHTGIWCEKCQHRKGTCKKCASRYVKKWTPGPIWHTLAEAEKRERRQICAQCYTQGYTMRNCEEYVCSRCNDPQGSRWYCASDLYNTGRVCGRSTCGRSHRPCDRCGLITAARDKTQAKNWKARYETSRFVCPQCADHGYVPGDLEMHTCRDCSATGGADNFDKKSVKNSKLPGRLPPFCSNRAACQRRCKEAAATGTRVKTPRLK